MRNIWRTNTGQGRPKSLKQVVIVKRYAKTTTFVRGPRRWPAYTDVLCNSRYGTVKKNITSHWPKCPALHR